MKAKAAIYARRSVEQRVSPEMKSVARQVENARAYADQHGWEVTGARVFVDDAISGREFKKRRGLQGMLAAARRREFSILVVAEQKALGREQIEVAGLVKDLAQVGVVVHAYLQDKQLTPRNALDKLLLNVQGYSDEDHAVKTGERMREAHKALAMSGRVTGGKLYGYRNVDVFNGTDPSGRPIRSHVDREIDREQAEVIRRIFREFVAGRGLKAIAKGLTADGIPSPRPNDPRQSLKAWAGSTVNAILGREIYAGTATWGIRRKRDPVWGHVNVTKQPEESVVRVPRPDLAIIDQRLWAQAAARRAETAGKAIRFSTGRLSGRPRKGGEVALLAGLASCGACGGGIVCETSGAKRRYTFYACHRRRHHGSHVCANAMRLPAAEVEEAVLAAIEEHVLTPQQIEEFLLRVEAEESADAERRRRLEAELKELGRSEARLVAVLEKGDDAPAVVLARLKGMERRREAIDQELKAAQPIPRLKPRVVESRLAEWRRILRGSVTQARGVLQRVLAERIKLSVLPSGLVEFEAATRFSRLFAGVVVQTPPETEPPPWIKTPDTRGHEAGVEEGQTIETAYEALLQAAEAKLEKRWRPWWDSNPRSPP